MGIARKIGNFLLYATVATAAIGYFKPNYLKETIKFFQTEKTKIEKKAEDFDRPKIKKDEESTALSEMAGRYTCSISNISSQIIMTSTDIPVEISKDGNGRLKITFIDPIFRTNWSADLKQKGSNNFSFSHYAGRNTAIGSLGMKNAEKLTLHLDVNTVHNGRSSVNYTCRALKHKNTKKDKIDDTIRAVFIRPCEGDFYNPNAFSNKDPAGQTAVGGGTLDKVCKDLKDSGVTDVFLPFKVDDETNSHCGKSGELLYDSTTYKEYVNPRFRAAFEKGFDPIKALINACRGINFHAWFPVFNDREAAQIAGQGANGIFYSPL